MKMKDSGIEWIGEIPEHWEVMPLKAILIERKEKNNPIRTKEILSLTINQGVIPYSEKVGLGGNKPKEDLTKYKLTYPNDIVVNSMNVLAGAINISRIFGAVSPVYYTLYSASEKFKIEFFNNLFQTKPFQESLLGLGNGILIKKSESTGKLNTIRMRVPMKKLGTISLPVPSDIEQQKITNFLDEKTAKIDRIIKLTKKSIEEYKNYKKSLITETVTKGLNPDVKMKDSGIEWIGEIPEHWGLTKVRRLLEMPITDGPHETPKFFDTGIPFISAEAIKNNSIDFKHKRGYISYDDYKRFSKKYIPKINDIYMVKSGATTGKIAKVNTDETFTIWSPLAVFRANIELLKPDFLFNYLYSDAFQTQIILKWNYGTQQNIGMRVLETLLVQLPPLPEQQKIADFLDKKCAYIDKFIDQKERLISELETYKKSMIFEYVTGKKEVL